MKVIFDSNVLIEDIHIIDVFPKESILFPTFLIRELDSLKKRFPKLKYIIKFIKKHPECTIDVDYSLSYVDDKIVEFIRNNKTYKNLHLITNDVILQIRCHHLKVEISEFKKPVVFKDTTFLYKKEFSAEQIQELNENKTSLMIDKVNYNSFTKDVVNNLLVFNNIKEGKYELIEMGRREECGGPINIEQVACMKLLMNKNIPAVFLRGGAGSGKSTIAVIAALQLLDFKTTKKNKNDKKESIYKQISICRPNISLGKEIGYLPGSDLEKTMPFLNPIKDAFKVVFKDNPEAFEDMLDQKMVEIIPMAFLRGRSLNNQIVIIDEAQNCNFHELKSILTRVGKNCKIILTGDTDQFDIRNSGLTKVINKLINEKLIGQYVLEKCERSELADLCVKKLKKINKQRQ